MLLISESSPNTGLLGFTLDFRNRRGAKQMYVIADIPGISRINRSCVYNFPIHIDAQVLYKHRLLRYVGQRQMKFALEFVEKAEVF